MNEFGPDGNSMSSASDDCVILRAYGRYRRRPSSALPQPFEVMSTRRNRTARSGSAVHVPEKSGIVCAEATDHASTRATTQDAARVIVLGVSPTTGPTSSRTTSRPRATMPSSRILIVDISDVGSHQIAHNDPPHIEPNTEHGMRHQALEPGLRGIARS